MSTSREPPHTHNAARASDEASLVTKRERGPIEILCEEIDFPWDRRLEREDLLVEFVRGLVAEITEDRELAERIAHLTGKPPSKGSLAVLAVTGEMLAAKSARDLIGWAALVHESCHHHNPEDAYPTDHLIDMLSSCASAIRFGLEKPCHSRHAAEAANHVWKRLCGVTRFDSHTPAWSKAWARSCLMNAVISLMAPGVQSACGASDAALPAPEEH
jgi:hypothetical protein